MNALKSFLKRFFTKKGARNRKVVKDIIAQYGVQPLPLKIGHRYRGTANILRRFGSKVSVEYSLYTYPCALRGYHHCTSAVVVLEEGNTSITVLLFNTVTGTYIKTIWS